MCNVHRVDVEFCTLKNERGDNRSAIVEVWRHANSSNERIEEREEGGGGNR